MLANTALMHLAIKQDGIFIMGFSGTSVADASGHNCEVLLQ